MINVSQVGNDLYTGKRSIDFIGRQRTWYAVSAVLIVLALVGIFARGLNFGIEFRGGSEFRINGVTNTQGYEAKAQAAISQAGIGGNVLTTVIGGNSVRVQTEAANESNEAAKVALGTGFGVPATNVSASLIGPSWGQSVSTKAIQALVVFLILVALVMAIYFRTWTMAVAGLVALIHDLVITVGIYALFGFEITPSSMIGFLTILGYSLYDTVVVFDKVRENTTAAMANRRRTYAQAANLAVNQTLVRSVNTTVVALLPIAAILVVGFTRLGPGTLLDLSLALFVGIAVGAYSSIFIATPLLVDLRRGEAAVKDLDQAASRAQSKTKVAVPVGAGAPAEAQTTLSSDGSTHHAAGSTVVQDVRAADGAPREVHKWAQSGPRNQPKRPPKSKR
ncbi:protein translocase subunit SecF [Lapillicoccus sp.]|uniref:protein translocase subunit SecF n=1 Tax=Lapillicoccus sp. TaxID=1909287 RepID=UPI003983BFE6